MNASSLRNGCLLAVQWVTLAREVEAQVEAFRGGGAVAPLEQEPLNTRAKRSKRLQALNAL
eukprot:15148868-Alexandrium_andersonii.AAC.1